MRILWLIISLLLLGVVSVGVAQKAAELRSQPRLSKRSNAFEWLIAGYKEIPAEPLLCSGTSSGTINIKLSNVLGKLHDGKTIYRDMTFVPANGPGAIPPRILPADVARIRGFQTNLDLKTTVESNGVRQRVVGGTNYVTIRVTLDTTDAGANDQVVFMKHPSSDNSIEGSSRFAVLQAYGVDKPMFGCRQPIKLDAAKNPYVEFVVRSVGIPYSGSFGIGLLVKELNSQLVTPIIIDPNVENEG